MASVNPAATSLIRRSNILLARHPTRGVNRAAVDRYSTIRSFFRRQHTLNLHPSVPQNPFIRPSYSASLRVDLAVSIGARLLVRRVHSGVHKDENTQSRDSANLSKANEGPPSPDPGAPRYLDNYSLFFRRLAISLPHLHRPTRDDLLNVANGFWQRARIRFKWFTIKSFRKFNADDISAFVTWFLMSQTLWILLGT